MVGEGSLLGDRYRLGPRMASGGMGTIHSATDEKLGRTVAVKLLRSDLTGDGVFVERFRREARAAASLSHPNVAAVYDFGEESGTPFIVMEQIDGRDLARVIREDGPLDAGAAAHIAAQVADALAHAHAAGLVHRDVKPANVMVEPSGRVRVTDFGIARASGDSTLTATGSVLGTAHYISPEQAGGAPAGPRSDIYSLGIVLYEMLTGSLPFTGESPVAVAMRHMSDEVPNPRALRSDLPAALERVVAKATAKDPAERYQSASDVSRDLRAGGDTEPLAVHDATETQTIWPVPGDRWDPKKVGAIALISLGILGLIAALLLITRATEDDPSRPRGERREGAAAEPRTPETAAEATSAPPEEQPSMTMPDLTGFRFQDVQKELEANGFGVSVVFTPSDEDKHIVVATDPAEDAELQEGQTITLYVSDGKGDEGHGSDKEDKDEDD